MNELIHHCFKPITPIEEILKKKWTFISDGLPDKSCICFVMKKMGEYKYSIALLKFDAKNKHFSDKSSDNYAWKII